MAEVIFSEEPLTDNHCQAKQGRKFFPASAVRVRMRVRMSKVQTMTLPVN